MKFFLIIGSKIGDASCLLIVCYLEFSNKEEFMFTFIAFFIGGRNLGAFGFQLSFNGLAYKA